MDITIEMFGVSEQYLLLCILHFRMLVLTKKLRIIICELLHSILLQNLSQKFIYIDIKNCHLWVLYIHS